MPQIRLLLVLFDVEPVGLSVDFPVDMPQLIARIVRAVFGKLDRKAVVGTSVEAGDKALDDQPRPQLHIIELGDRYGVEKLEG